MFNMNNTSNYNLTATEVEMTTVYPARACSASHKHTLPDSSLSVLARVELLHVYVRYPVLALGILGNLLTLLTLRQPTLRETPYIRLTALAVSDLVSLILTLVSELIEKWESCYKQMYLVYFYNPLVNMAATFGVFVMVVMTVERCILLKFPLKRQVYNRRWPSFVIILIFSISINTPRFAWFKVNECRWPSHNGTITDKTTCEIVGHLAESRWKDPYQIVQLLFKYMAPMLLLSLLNTYLVYKLRAQSKRRVDLGVNRTTRAAWSREQIRLTITLISIVGLFILLVLPSAFLSVDLNGHDLFQGDQALKRTYRFISNFLVWINLSMNFLLYTVVNTKFQAAFKRMINGWRCWKTRQPDLMRRGSRYIIRRTVTPSGIAEQRDNNTQTTSVRAKRSESRGPAAGRKETGQNNVCSNPAAEPKLNNNRY